MQTFLPYEDFALSAQVLDRQRLGKQRVETLQIVKTLVRGGGWQHHPAVKMWRGHVPALVAYQDAICFEWHEIRGYKDTCLDKTIEIAGTTGNDFDRPYWLGDPEFHMSHRSRLIQKDFEYYAPRFPNTPSDLEYKWPS
jgi:Pyrimidine dimer DNA glycosylase